jgi:hypothetical protein
MAEQMDFHALVQVAGQILVRPPVSAPDAINLSLPSKRKGFYFLTLLSSKVQEQNANNGQESLSNGKNLSMEQLQLYSLVLQSLSQFYFLVYSPPSSIETVLDL